MIKQYKYASKWVATKIALNAVNHTAIYDKKLITLKIQWMKVLEFTKNQMDYSINC